VICDVDHHYATFPIEDAQPSQAAHAAWDRRTTHAQRQGGYTPFERNSAVGVRKRDT